MSSYLKEYQKKVGLAPNKLVHIGNHKTQKSQVSLIIYDEKSFEEKEINKIEEFKPDKSKKKINWINIDGIHDIEFIEHIGNHFKIHPLVLVDIVNTRHHPKVEDYGDFLFIVMKMIYFDKKKGKNIADQISLILGHEYVITFQEVKNEFLNTVKERIRLGDDAIRKMGADYLAYSIIDTIVDNYFVIIEDIGERIEDVEEELLKTATDKMANSIHKIKREMILIRKSVVPLREVLNSLEKSDSELIQQSNRVYLKDIYDHIIQLTDTIQSSGEMLTGMLDIYMSSINNRLNKIMMLLTVISTIFMPLTLITGIYGMNFKHMPELEWTFSYPAVLIIMLIIGVTMLIYYKKKKWL